jgi:hypothetical protein
MIDAGYMEGRIQNKSMNISMFNTAGDKTW